MPVAAVGAWRGGAGRQHGADLTWGGRRGSGNCGPRIDLGFGWPLKPRDICWQEFRQSLRSDFILVLCKVIRGFSDKNQNPTVNETPPHPDLLQIYSDTNPRSTTNLLPTNLL